MTTQTNKPSGFSMTSFMAVLVVLGVAAVFAMKIVPMYIEFNAVKSAMDALSQEDFETAGAIKESLTKRFSISYVETATLEDVTILPGNGKYTVSIDYYDEKPLVGNLSITAHFEHEVVTH